MQPNAISIEVECSTTSAEATTDGEMLSGPPLSLSTNLLVLNLFPRVEATPIQERSEILGSVARSHQATACSQAALSLESSSRCRQDEGPNVHVLTLVACLYGWRQMSRDQQKGTLCTRAHVFSLGEHGKQDVQARRHDRSRQAQSHTPCSSLPERHARIVYQFCASAVLECRDPTCRSQLANLWWVWLENCDK
jgi:hypothetical protein